MKIVTLGTGGTIPTPVRNLPATALQRGAEIFLFDCGEGTQLQFLKAGLSPGKLKAVFISHLHGDHILGLPGLLMTLNHLSRKHPLSLFGPPGISDYIQQIHKCLQFAPGYELTVKESKGGRIHSGSDYWVDAVPVDHTVLTLAYLFEENERPGRFLLERARQLGVPEGSLYSELQAGKDITLSDGRAVRATEVLGNPRRGRKVVYAVDTCPCQQVVNISTGADLLIHDGMFSDQLREEARLKGHSTVVQAAEIAQKAKVEELLLTHISPRYRDQDALLQKEAMAIFPRSTVAKDLMKFEIPIHK
ncbi:MAG: ribonuclease Z [Candidatus Latescibacteria bacterium]|nr:ribonuclease Z [Candidatus Latescibacterota bacterium]